MNWSTSKEPAAPPRRQGEGVSAWRLWGWPVALGALTASGLLSALVSEAGGDAWSWFALGVPVAVMAWFARRRRPLSARAPRLP